MGERGEAETAREILEGSTLAHSDEYESIAVASCLFEANGDEVIRRLRVLDENEGLFYREGNRELVRWANRLVKEGAAPANLLRDEWWGLLAAAVRHRDPLFWERQAKKTIAGLLDYYSASVNFDWTLEQLAALQVTRERQAIANRELQSTKGMSTEELEAFWAEQNTKLQRMILDRKASIREAASASELFGELKANHARLSKGEGVMLGIPSVDNAMRGMSPGDLICLAARAGVGKTTLCANILHHVARPAAKDAGAWAVVFSLDMAAPEFFEKMIMRSAGVRWKEIFDATKVERVEGEGLARFDRTLVDNSSSLTVAELEARVMTYRHKIAEERRRLGERGVDVPPALIVIDHHGHVKPSNPRLKSRYEKASESVQEIKEAAKRLETVVLLCVQLSRKAGEGEIEVGMDMLRDSGVIEEEGDLILGAWRPRRGQGPEDNELMLKVMKARRMAGTVVTMEWKPEIAFVHEAGEEPDWWDGTGAQPERDPWGLGDEGPQIRREAPADRSYPEDPPF